MHSHRLMQGCHRCSTRRAIRFRQLQYTAYNDTVQIRELHGMQPSQAACTACALSGMQRRAQLCNARLAAACISSSRGPRGVIDANRANQLDSPVLGAACSRCTDCQAPGWQRSEPLGRCVSAYPPEHGWRPLPLFGPSPALVGAQSVGVVGYRAVGRLGREAGCREELHAAAHPTPACCGLLNVVRKRCTVLTPLASYTHSTVRELCCVCVTPPPQPGTCSATERSLCDRRHKSRHHVHNAQSHVDVDTYIIRARV